MRLVEGQIIHRRYRLDTQIAHGGMGEVWKAWDTVLHRTVAVKVLRSDVLADHQHLARLRAEARNSADLAHPNIAALFDYYEEDGAGFIIMEYVPNESLAQIYKREGRMDPARLLAILSQVARGLYVAHERGVIHRDVKPANIMVAPNGQVKITDFGVSYSTNQAPITAAGMVVGTAQYISPEQAQGKKATPQSDIYSLGVVAYEGLAGHRPFTGATPVDIAAAQVNDPVPPLPADTDPQLAAYVMRMLAKDPAQRPRTALDVSHTFSQIEKRLVDASTGTFPAVPGGAPVPASQPARMSEYVRTPVPEASAPVPPAPTSPAPWHGRPADEDRQSAQAQAPAQAQAQAPQAARAAQAGASEREDPAISRVFPAHGTDGDGRAGHHAAPEHALPPGSAPRHRAARVVRSAPHPWHRVTAGHRHGEDQDGRQEHPFLTRLGERMRHLQEEVTDLLSEPDDGAPHPSSAPQSSSTSQPSSWQSGAKADTFEKRNEEDPDE